MKITHKVSKGFTLIELLVVIAIIALLTGMLMVNFTQSKAKSRDARRTSDLNQIQLALEQYFDRCGQYPNAIIGDLSTINNGCAGLTPAITLGSYISKIPDDPSNTGSYVYSYVTNAAFTDYVLHSTLEIGSSAQQNSFPETLHTNFKHTNSTSETWTCYDPTNPSSKEYCIGPK